MEATAGVELDALVAEKVMGWRRERLHDLVLNPGYFNGHGPLYKSLGEVEYLVPPNFVATSEGVGARLALTSGLLVGGEDIPPYSTDIASAWTVIEALLRRRDNPMEDVHIQHLIGRWSVSFCHTDPPDPDDPQWDGWGHSDTAPEAICRAALLAVGG